MTEACLRSTGPRSGRDDASIAARWQVPPPDVLVHVVAPLEVALERNRLRQKPGEGDSEEYIRRVHYGQLAKQAQSRRKALDRLERVERPTMIETPHITRSTDQLTATLRLTVPRAEIAWEAVTRHPLSGVTAGK